MQDKILKLLARSSYTPSNVPELLQKLGLQPNQQQELQRVLAQMEQSGLILRNKGNRYISAQEADLVSGVISINRQGKGFLQPDTEGLGEITIPESETSIALHGDRVLVRRDVRPPSRRGGPAEATGSVVRILERKRTKLVGTLRQGHKSLYVVPDDPRIPHDITVPEPRDVGRPAYVGDKVVVELVSWESNHAPPEGEIIEVLGAPDQEGVDMLSVLRQYDLALHFPKKVLQEANAISRARKNGEPLPEELVDRVDCREDLVITIDPDDAKDFDDAIFLERRSGDRWKLCVHIADVSHYVKPGTELDTEARRRGNSTYLVDRVIPMLPEALSNEVCSLKPHVDRLTKCVEFTLSDNGAVLQAKFYPAVIHSKKRYSYQQAFAVLQRAPQDEIETMLHHASDLAQKIRRLRFSSGALSLDFPDSKIRLDEQGKVLRIERMENDISHQLIEEYMLLANEAVAGRMMSQRKPGIFRVHEPPKENRLAQYREEVLSHRISCGDLNNRPEVQKLLQKLEHHPAGAALRIGLLKSLMRARYAVEPLGHYGLNKPKYTHFTSPIRRYADLIVHRILFDRVPMTFGALSQSARHISDTERTSADAERDSKDVKLYAYLTAQLQSGRPQVYTAMVTDVQNFGFFVDVSDLTMSGMVRLSAIPDDFYVYDPDRNQIVGRRTHRVIKLGSMLEVQVSKVDSQLKRVDFTLAADRPRFKPREAREEPPFQKGKKKQEFRGGREEFRPREESPFYKGKPKKEFRGGQETFQPREESPFHKGKPKKEFRGGQETFQPREESPFRKGKPKKEFRGGQETFQPREESPFQKGKPKKEFRGGPESFQPREESPFRKGKPKKEFRGGPEGFPTGDQRPKKDRKGPKKKDGKGKKGRPKV